MWSQPVNDTSLLQHYCHNKTTLRNIINILHIIEKNRTEQGCLSNAQTTTHSTVTSQALMSYDFVLLHADLWHCSVEACKPTTERFAAMTASFKLLRLAVCFLLHRFRLTASTTEQLTPTSALSCRDVSDTECTVALSWWTAQLSVIRSVTKDEIWPCVLPAYGCVVTDNIAPASCTAAGERRTKHRLLVSWITSNDPRLFHPTPHVPNSI